MLLSIFRSPQKKNKLQKQIEKNSKKNKKYVAMRKDVGAPRKWLKIGWGGLKMQKLKFHSISLTDESPVDKENSIWEKNIKNQMFMDSIKFYRRFNSIFRGFDCKKNWFWS